MPQDERAKTGDSGDPDPAVTAGLQDGGPLQPGDTPPAADSMSGALGEDRTHSPNKGPVSGNRTPMVIALGSIAVIVVMVAILVGASFIAS